MWKADPRLSTYTLIAGFGVYGSPVWGHLREDRYDAPSACGDCIAQRRADLGEISMVGSMYLEDNRHVLPHECNGEWEEVGIYGQGAQGRLRYCEAGQ